MWFDPYDQSLDASQTGYIQLNIKSLFDHVMDFELTVYFFEVDEYENPISSNEIILTKYDWIDPYSHITTNISYIFPFKEHFVIQAELIDDIGAKWYANGHIFVDKEFTTTKTTTPTTTTEGSKTT